MVGLQVARSDARVANFFWVPSPETQIESGMLVDAYKIITGYPLDINHDANHPAIFGQRMMQSPTVLYPDATTDPLQLLPPGSRPAAASGYAKWAQLRAAQLITSTMTTRNSRRASLHTVKDDEDVLPGLLSKLTTGHRSQRCISNRLTTPFRRWCPG